MTDPTRHTDPVDVRDILGLRTPVTYAMVGLVVIAMLYGAAQSLAGVSPRWPVLLVTGIIAAATIALITVPHDPLPLGPAIAIALAPPLAAAILLMVVPVPLAIGNQVWVSGYATLIYVFMCIRGQYFLAWASVAVSVLVHAGWSAATDQGMWAGAHIPLYNAGALLAVTLIAHALRTTTASVLSLRAAGFQRAADASAIAAALEERHARLAELGELAQPALARIATGVPLSDAERQSCELLEANLRDQLRAPALVSPETTAATRAARARGVEVMLIDDGGLVDVPEPVKSVVRREVIAALQSADNGEVRVRVLPPGRDTVATIYQHDEAGTHRIDIDGMGHIAKDTRTPRLPGQPHTM